MPNSELRERTKQREAATIAHVLSLNVVDLIEFTEPLRHPVYGGRKFDVEQILCSVRSYWAAKCKSLAVSPPSTPKPQYLVPLEEQIKALSLDDKEDAKPAALPIAKRQRMDEHAAVSAPPPAAMTGASVDDDVDELPVGGVSTDNGDDKMDTDESSCDSEDDNIPLAFLK